MQQVATGPDIWRRASRSPPPRPVLKAPLATVRRPRRAVRRRSDKSRTWLFAVIATAPIAIGIGLLAIPTVPSARPPSLLAQMEDIAEEAGFGLTQISLTGQRRTPDEDVFDALDLAHARTMLSFDSRAARARIERLPWIERATIERVVPDRLDIHVTERTPFAIWQAGARHVLIDRTGRILGPVPTGTSLDLPHFAGDGAAEEAARLWERLAQYLAVRSQLDLAERVGQRRWTLHLVNGSTILLPADDEAQALGRAASLIAGRRIREIDLRVPGRTLVRDAASQDKAARIEQARNPIGGG